MASTASLAPSASLAHIRTLYVQAGTRQYGGEAVSQLEHALQAAWFAERNQESDALVVACLLHDLGHLLFDADEAHLQASTDDRHEARVVPYLHTLFGADVTAPIGMHVDAKRYLCQHEPAYHATLSPASQHSLRLQGGAMTQTQAGRFIASAYAHQAVALRRYDDAAKIEGLATPGFDYFLPRLEAVSARSGR